MNIHIDICELEKAMMILKNNLMMEKKIMKSVWNIPNMIREFDDEYLKDLIEDKKT